MLPDPSTLIHKLGLDIPLVGFYDAPDAAPFAPLLEPKPGRRACVFSFFKQWQKGKTLHLTAENHGCGGAGNWLFGVQGRSRQEFVEFLVGKEGLKASHELMNRWLDHSQPYQAQHAHLLIGPLRPEQAQYLKTITFYANPDQISALILGAQYYYAPGDPPPVSAPFGAGCMQLLPLLADLDAPQAIIGASDIAMRQYLPPDVLAFTVTLPMFQRLCELDEGSFLYKPFWANLRKARGL
jgi:hypothetical protein